MAIEKRKGVIVGVVLVVLCLGLIGFQVFSGGDEDEDMAEGDAKKPRPVASTGYKIPSGQTNLPPTIIKLREKTQTNATTPAVPQPQPQPIVLPQPPPAASPVPANQTLGVAFVESAMKPIYHELHDRLWGWRPNDIVDFCDNVNNYQKGILEVTRRTAVALNENLSRTGSTDAIVPCLEAAMNAFMILADRFWFPSAENKYEEGLENLEIYLEMLKSGEARFYRRVDNLVPLFRAYMSLLGSCDENLVKERGKMSTTKADDYFYYSKGIAHAMYTILKGGEQDIIDTIQSAQLESVLQLTITALEEAADMNPWIVLESSPDSVLANHRANMAAPISHARFYLGVLIKTLST